MHVDYVPNPELHPVIDVDDDASSRASPDGWLTLIPGRAALAPVHKEGPAAAHLLGLLGVQVEGAGTGHGRVVHGVLAVGKLVLGRWKGAGVNYTLLFGVHVTRALP